MCVCVCVMGWGETDTGLANGPQEPPGPRIPKGMVGGVRSATVMLSLPPHPESEACVERETETG